MSDDLTKKAVEMLLKGATLLGEPCPYCKGVRVLQDGNALCVNCGKHAKNEHPPIPETDMSSSDDFDNKIKELTMELQKEKNIEKQKQILQSINEIISAKEKKSTI